MRAFLAFCALLLVCMFAGAMLAYPAWLLVHPLNEGWPFHRIANRISMLFALIGMFWLLKHLGVANRRDLGYGLARPAFTRQLISALFIGALSMLPVIAMLFALDIRIWRPGIGLDAVALSAVLAQGLLTGIVVGFIEETLLRGALFSAVERESGKVAAVGLTAALYAALHFLNSVRIAHENVAWDSGLELLSGALRAFGDPARIVDSFLALFAVGVLLGLVRIRTGSVAACIGLHAGWVWVITSVRELSKRSTDTQWAFLVGGYDGVIGYLVLGWTVALCLAFWLTTHRQRFQQTVV